MAACALASAVGASRTISFFQDADAIAKVLGRQSQIIDCILLF
jgi:hypothetical protein